MSAGLVCSITMKWNIKFPTLFLLECCESDKQMEKVPEGGPGIRHTAPTTHKASELTGTGLCYIHLSTIIFVCLSLMVADDELILSQLWLLFLFQSLKD